MPDRKLQMDPAYPLALLPIRLQTRFVDKHLRVRVLPDLIHAGAHDDRLTEREIIAGTQYWRRLDEVKETPEDVTLIRSWLASQVGQRRALWVAEAMQPQGWSGHIYGEPLIFPSPDTMEAHEPVRAELMPQRWHWRVYGTQMNLVGSGTAPHDVAAGLRMAPTLAALDEGAAKAGDGVKEFLYSQHLGWMLDFEEAVKRGMAFTIPRADLPNIVGGIFVSGLCASEDTVSQADALDAQFRNHWYAHGLDILPQGTPTNVTDLGRTDPEVATPTLDALFAQNAQRRPAAAALRAMTLKQDPANLLLLPAADTASVALGMTFSNTLDRVPNAEATEVLGATSFTAAIGIGLARLYADYIFTEIGGNAPLAPYQDEIIAHMFDWTRGSAALPCLRVGAQPYGLLPTLVSLEAEIGKDGDLKTLVSGLLALYPEWLKSFPLPTLDPEAVDGAPTVQPEEGIEVLTKVLGAVPHPTNLHLRGLTNHTGADADLLLAITAELDGYANLDQAPIQDFLPEFVFFHELWESWRAKIEGLPNDAEPNVKARTIDRQIQAVEGLLNDIDQYAPSHIEDLMLEAINGRLMPLLQIYLDVTDAMPDALTNLTDRGGLSIEPPKVVKPKGLMNFIGSAFEDERIKVGVLVTTKDDLGDLFDLLEKMIPALEKSVPPADRKPVLEDEAPLLQHLLHQSYMRATSGQTKRLAGAFKLIQARIDSQSDGLADEFARFMQEVLGLFMNRLDAWITSIATRELAKLRADKPRGVNLGAYGWLTDLMPRAPDARQTDGFIHASSMSHAATAAVLRSGWRGFGSADGTAPLSVDLTSDRVRGAEWVLDGIRAGQDIADVLGARFERRLHDDALALDDWIDTIRLIVNGDKGTPNPAASLTDGWLLARAYSVDRTEAEENLNGELQTVTQPSGNTTERRKRRQVRAAFQSLASDLDSVADLLMAQTVHSLAQGNDAQAAATLNLTGDAGGSVPEITVPQTQREGQSVTHRLLALFDPATVAAAGSAGLELAEPRLVHWLTARLPATDRINIGVWIDKGDGDLAQIGRMTLTDAGLDAVTAFALAGRTETQAKGALARVLLTRAAEMFATNLDGATPILRTDEQAKDLSLDDFGLLAGAARDALAAARPARPATFDGPDSHEVTGDEAVDDNELGVRAAELTNWLQNRLEHLATLATEEIAQLAAMGVIGAIDLIENSSDADRLDQVATALGDKIAALQDTTQPAAARLATACGGVLPILPIIVHPDHALIAASAANPARADAQQNATPRWWRQVRKVNAGAEAMGLFLDITSGLGAPDPGQPAIAQRPDLTEPWAAVSKPLASPRDRLCLFAVTGGALIGDDRVAGLVLDSWTEAIPLDNHQTGLAVNFDAPTARAPQAILLARLATDDKHDEIDQVFAQMEMTLTLAKLRVVPPDGQAGIGHYFPATFLPGETKITEGSK